MEDTKVFRNFDVVSDDSDHHFLHNNRNWLGKTNSFTHERIMKEWKILEKNLPDSIYVRVYEGRIDLMRAAIVGTAGTPYHDGLFVFDIAFPSNYPNSPPEIYFMAFGLPLNAYVLFDGTLCMSLLESKSEKWNPSMSTCQLLLSIQALVLAKDPFNEPSGKDLTREAMYRMTREAVYRNTCQIALHLLHRPPNNFQSLVKAHFRDRAAKILAAFIEYATGRLAIGHYGTRAHMFCVRHKVSFPEAIGHYGTRARWCNVSVPQSYKRWAQEFYPLMISAFKMCGASLDTYPRKLKLMFESEEKTFTWEKIAIIIKKAFSWRRRKKKNINGEDSDNNKCCMTLWLLLVL